MYLTRERNPLRNQENEKVCQFLRLTHTARLIAEARILRMGIKMAGLYPVIFSLQQMQV